MPSLDIDDFLRSVLAQVKFPFDKAAIRAELESHFLDRIDEYLEQGYDEETAERLSVEGMGDPQEIGIELNKQHNPIIGWLWWLSHIAIVILVVINIFIVGIPIISSLIPYDPAKGIAPNDIVYNIKINQKVRLDDTLIKFTNVIFEKNGDLNIIYEHYDTRLWGGGWSLGGIGTVSDDLGNEYWSGSGSSNGGIITKGIRTIENFDKEAEKLIISYEGFNRSYRVEIPLKAGEIYE